MTRGEYKPNILINATQSGLRKDSVAIIPLITALDTIGFVERISKLPSHVTESVYKAVLDFIK